MQQQFIPPVNTAKEEVKKKGDVDMEEEL